MTSPRELACLSFKKKEILLILTFPDPLTSYSSLGILLPLGDMSSQGGNTQVESPVI